MWVTLLQFERQSRLVPDVVGTGLPERPIAWRQSAILIAMALLATTLSCLQYAPAWAGEPVSGSSEVGLSLTIAPLMDMAPEETPTQSPLHGGVSVPGNASVPDFGGVIARVMAGQFERDNGGFVLRNAAGAVIPFTMRVVSPSGDKWSESASGKGMLLELPKIAEGWQSSVELGLSAEDLLTAQKGGYTATVVIMLSPEI
jgi:hypothetical protein